MKHQSRFLIPLAQVLVYCSHSIITLWIHESMKWHFRKNNLAAEYRINVETRNTWISECMLILNTTLFFYNSYCTLSPLWLWGYRFNNLCQFRFCAVPHPKTVYEFQGLGHCYDGGGNWGSAGNGNQVLGRHLPPSAPAEAPLLPGGPQSLNQGGGSCVWSPPSLSKGPFLVGPKAIWLFSTRSSTPFPTPDMGNIYHSVRGDFLWLSIWSTSLITGFWISNWTWWLC